MNHYQINISFPPQSFICPWAVSPWLQQQWTVTVTLPKITLLCFHGFIVVFFPMAWQMLLSRVFQRIINHAEQIIIFPWWLRFMYYKVILSHKSFCLFLFNMLWFFTYTQICSDPTLWPDPTGRDDLMGFDSKMKMRYNKILWSDISCSQKSPACLKLPAKGNNTQCVWYWVVTYQFYSLVALDLH